MRLFGNPIQSLSNEHFSQNKQKRETSSADPIRLRLILGEITEYEGSSASQRQRLRRGSFSIDEVSIIFLDSGDAV